MTANQHLGSQFSDEDRVSLAENAMENGGLTGRSYHVPAGKYDWATHPQKHPEVHDFVHSVLSDAGVERAKAIRVQPNHWDLRKPGSGQAVTDGANYIGIKGEHTNDMTLLHEAAHIIHGTGEHEGHGKAFQETLHGLYRKHLGDEAADTFHRIIKRV